jgi:hypothetical protein
MNITKKQKQFVLSTIVFQLVLNFITPYFLSILSGSIVLVTLGMDQILNILLSLYCSYLLIIKQKLSKTITRAIYIILTVFVIGIHSMLFMAMLVFIKH